MPLGRKAKKMYGMGGSTGKRAESPYKYGGMTKGEMMLHGGNTKPGSTFNGHRCEKRNLCQNMTGYTFDANGVGKRGKAPKANNRPKNFIG